jgi:hypothetical protein
MLLMSAAVVALLLWWAELGVHVGGARAPLAACVAGMVGAHFHQPGRASIFDKIVFGTEALSMLALISTLGGLASYAVASQSHGYVDQHLVRADNFLGLDWISYWRFVGSSRYVPHVLNAAYVSILVSPGITILILIFSGESKSAYQFLTAFGIALGITNIVFFFAPARAAAATYLGVDAPLLADLQIEHVHVIEALRSGALTSVPLDHLVALITFPSFHAACAFLFIWAAWRVFWLRLASLLINGTMLLATPVQGSHYFIDVAGGAVVATIGIVLAMAWGRHNMPSAALALSAHMPAYSP